MFVYIDESGNTGLDLFSTQDKFYLAALIASENLDSALSEVINKYLIEYNVKSIHAVNLSFDQLKPLLADLIEALNTIKYEFYSVEIDKKYYLNCQFFDVFFDSHYNNSVGVDEYFNPMYKHSVCLKINDALTLDEKKQFWEAYKKKNIKVFSQITEALAKRLEKEDDGLDRVIVPALRFASLNPDRFTREDVSIKHFSPNVIAFSGCIHRIHDFAETNNLKPQRITIDREDQFSSTFKYYHNILKQLYMTPQEERITPSTVQIASNPLPDLTVADSHTSNGLQAVDVLLYIFRSRHKELSSIFKLGLDGHLEGLEISPRVSYAITQAFLEKRAGL